MDRSGTVEGNFVDVINDKIFPARIHFEKGKITSIEESKHEYSTYILPGLIDSHVHVESSLLVPSRFAEMAIPHGTCSVIADPHEIANVMGMEGVEFMIKDAERSPMRFRFMAPSCVPATDFETSGAKLGPTEIEDLMKRPEIFGLAEMMNCSGVLNDDPQVMEKIAIAKRYGKPVDGHAPGLSGADLDRYIAAGISTDHECTTAKEAKEKSDKGMVIQVREGSACSNMKELVPAIIGRRFFFSTDDLQVGHCHTKGYMDRLLRMAVYYGVNPMMAVKAATIWPAEHYHLDEGSIRVGGPADIVIVGDLINFEVKRVYISGEKVAEECNALFVPEPLSCTTHIKIKRTIPEDYFIKYEEPSADIRTICVKNKQITSTEEIHTLITENGVIMPNVKNDVLLFSVVSRYDNSKPMVGFIKGFGFRNGAIASSISHDSHNLVAVATNYELLAEAINEISEYGGHYFTNGNETAYHSAPIAGLMSAEDPETAAFLEDRIIFFARENGCKLNEPFMTLEFQCLLVIPSLKMSDKGLFDNRRSEFVDLIKRRR